MAISSKIISISQLKEIRKNNKKRKIGLCHGVFDIVHPGHLFHFKEVKKKCDILVVSITSDKHIKKKRVVAFDKKTRLEQLACYELIDYVTCIDHKTALPAIKNLKPDFYAKGNEYKKLRSDPSRNIFSEKKEVNKHGGKLIFTNEKTFSSTKIGYFLDSKSEVNKQNKKKGFKIKYNPIYDLSVSLIDIKNALIKLKKLNIAVIGDTILDELVYSDVVSGSEKSNGNVLKAKRTISQLGGASAIARQLNTIGVKVDLYTNFNKEKLNHKFKFFKVSKKPIIHRTQYINEKSGKSIISIHRDENISIQKNCDNILKKLNSKKYDLIIISDYGYNVVPEWIIKKLKKNIFIAASVQTNTFNKGFNLIEKYKDADMIYMNKTEAKIQTKLKNMHSTDKIFSKLCNLFKKNKLVSMTVGNNVSYTKKGSKKIVMPKIVNNVNETMGCKEAFLALSSSTYVATKNIKVSSVIGSIASAYLANDISNHSSPDTEDILNISKIIL